MTQHTVTRGDILQLLEQALSDGQSKEIIERLQWFLHFEEHRSISKTCRQFGIARSTFYRWIRRFDPSNLSSLSDKPTHKPEHQCVAPLQSAAVMAAPEKNYLEQLIEESAERVKQHIEVPVAVYTEPISNVASQQPTPTEDQSRCAHCLWCRLKNSRNPIVRKLKLLALVFSVGLNIAFLASFLLPLSVFALAGDPKVLVNTESFSIIDEGDGTTDIYLQFGYATAEMLKFDLTNDRFEFSDDLHVDGTFSVESASLTDAAVTIDADGTSQAPHLRFGYKNTFDTNLYRETANVLRTDDSFNIRGNVEVAGTISGSSLELFGSDGSELVKLTNTSDDDSVGIFTGQGSPEGVVAATKGSLYVDSLNAQLFQKQTDSGSASWSEVATTSVMAQYQDYLGAQDVNQGSLTPIDWTLELREDTGFTHSNVSNESQIAFDEAGWYQVNYSISWESLNSNPKNIRCIARMNGTTEINYAVSYGFSANGTEDRGTNTSSFIIETTAADEYVEILCQGVGSTGVTDTILQESWIILEKK